VSPVPLLATLCPSNSYPQADRFPASCGRISQSRSPMRAALPLIQRSTYPSRLDSAERDIPSRSLSAWCNHAGSLTVSLTISLTISLTVSPAILCRLVCHYGGMVAQSYTHLAGNKKRPSRHKDGRALPRYHLGCGLETLS